MSPLTGSGAELPPSILVIEDDPMICKLLRVVLEHQGHFVRVADTFADGLETASDPDVKAVILDLNLPDGNGLELLNYIRTDLGRQTPVLVLTAFRQEDKALKAFELGANDFVTKPFSPRELVARLERVLGQ